MHPSSEVNNRLQPTDVQAVLATVDQFNKRQIAALDLSAEAQPNEKRVQEVLAEAEQLGILPSDTEPGFALWEEQLDPLALGMGLEVIGSIAQADVSIAFDIHQLALGKRLAKHLGQVTHKNIVPCLQATNGLARTALPRFLKGESLSSHDQELLLEGYPTNSQKTGQHLQLQATQNWEAVIRPVFSGPEPHLNWILESRDQLEVTQITAPLGLDHTNLWKITIKDKEPRHLETKQGRELLIETLGLNALAIIAMAIGSVRGAKAKAQEYARDRFQGGTSIDQHQTVNLYLGSIESIITTLQSALLSFQELPRNLAQLNDVFALRAQAHPLLCQAASEALQIFGGYGYMKDFGVEQILRANQHLRLCFGTPTELRLFLAAQMS
jgi:hypothetical protein